MTSPKPITVILAEDHVIVRQGLCALLVAEGSFHLVGEARNGREAVELAKTLRPDVILMDIAMPTLNGLEATRQILAANPTARIIILSAHSDDIYVEHLVTAGVAGFLEKQSSAEVLAQAIHVVVAGRTFFSPAIARRLEAARRPLDRQGMRKAHAARLTTREAEVLQMVAEGSANKQIAGELGISIKTVEKHRQHLMDKLNIHDTAGLTRHAIKTGVIDSGVQLTINLGGPNPAGPEPGQGGVAGAIPGPATARRASSRPPHPGIGRQSTVMAPPPRPGNQSCEPAGDDRVPPAASTPEGGPAGPAGANHQADPTRHQ